MDLPGLRNILVTYFSDSELRDVCFDLGIDYENLGGDAKAGKARELVAYCQRRNRLAELEDACRRLRPHAFQDSRAASADPGSAPPSPPSSDLTTAPPPTDAAYQYDVFISYSSKDKDWVRGKLLRTLEEHGLHACIDFCDFRPGAPSVKEIERAVLTSRKTLLILTPDYLASQWTEFEALLLQTLEPSNQNLRLIPLLKAKCDLPLRLRMLTYVNFDDPDDWDIAWKILLTALGAQWIQAAPAQETSAATASQPASNLASSGPSFTERPIPDHNAPQLQIEFDNKPPFCNVSKTTLFDEGGKVREGYWVRLCIKNNGKLPAVNCIGKLLEIRDRDGNRISRYDPETLAWRGDRQPVTLMPHGDFEYLDVWCSGINASYMRVRAKDPRIQGDNLKFKKGIYSIDVAVYAENAAPVRRTFRVEWEGEYNEVKMF